MSMNMTVANWKLVIQVRPVAAHRDDEPSAALVRQARRRELDAQVAHTRRQAHTRWMLLGGAQVR